MPATNALVAELRAHMVLPVIAAPMFIVSNPTLVIEQCKAGIIGSFPALNARQPEILDQWLTHINESLAQAKTTQTTPVSPFAVNQIIHASNPRLAQDVECCKRHRVPLLITSLSAPTEIVQEAHSWGARVFHDVISVRHAKKALQAGVDGLILVCAGAGGHAGTLSPFALVSEIRAFYDGVIILSGAMSLGNHILAGLSMGADFAYLGTRFICTTEANASDEYKQCIVQSSAEDIVYTNYFTGVLGNYLKPSIARAGLNPDDLPQVDKTKMDFAKKTDGGTAKAWKDIWGAGQGVGAIQSILPTAQVVAQLREEFIRAQLSLSNH